MKNLLLVFFTYCSLQLFPQIKITGKITDTNNNQPLEFAEVVLLNKDSMGIKSELANEDGTFAISIEQGRYTLQVRQFSKVFFSRLIDSSTDVDLGNIQVNNTAHDLSTVNLEVKGKLIERKVDRVVFNVENSVSAAGGDALDAIKVTPGVRVQDDKINMIGKSTVAVMVDDKLVQLSGDDLANYLKSIPADLIKSIEVITTPPANYDASGNSGYLNIKLKKSRRDAWNALVGASYFQRTYGDRSVNGNFNYNKNKLSFFASAFYRKGTIFRTEDDYSHFQDGLWHTHSSLHYNFEKFNGNVRLDYQLSSRWTIGTQAMIMGGPSNLANEPYSYVYDYTTGEKIRALENVSPSNLDPAIKSLNLYNEFKMDTSGRKLTVNMDYFNFSNSDRKQYKGTSVMADPFSSQYFEGVNINDQNITNLSAKLDIDFPVKWMNLSFGSKLSNSVSGNDISAFNSGVVDVVQPDYKLSESKFKYKENVEAVYVSANKKFNEKWQAQLGARVEATQTETFSENLNLFSGRNYIKLFPTAYVIYSINENSSFTLNYSRRINRPGFHDLNPNTYFLNPFQIIEGNPFLQPAFVDNAELVHAYKQLQSKIYFSYEDNMFAQLPVPDPSTSFIRYVNENYYTTKRVGISESYLFDKVKWWTSNNEINFNYTAAVSSVAIAKGAKGFNSRIFTSNDFTLNSAKTFVFNLSYWYNFRGVDGIFENLPQHMLSAAFQYLMLDKNLKLVARVNDPFRTAKDRTETTVNGVYQKGTYYNDSQSVQLAVSYKFGNTTIKVKQRETGNEEERKRTGN